MSNIVKPSLLLHLSVETSYRGIGSYHNNKSFHEKCHEGAVDSLVFHSNEIPLR